MSIENLHFCRGGSVSANMSGKRDVQHQPCFAWIDRPVDAVQLG